MAASVLSEFIKRRGTGAGALRDSASLVRQGTAGLGSRPGPRRRGVDRLLTGTPAYPSRRLSLAYLGVVSLVWLSHLLVLLLWLMTGRTGWTTQNPVIVVPSVVVAAMAVGTIWWVDRLLNRDRPPITQAFRMIALSYGSAVPIAWRRLRSSRD